MPKSSTASLLNTGVHHVAFKGIDGGIHAASTSNGHAIFVYQEGADEISHILFFFDTCINSAIFPSLQIVTVLVGKLPDSSATVLLDVGIVLVIVQRHDHCIDAAVASNCDGVFSVVVCQVGQCHTALLLYTSVVCMGIERNQNGANPSSTRNGDFGVGYKQVKDESG